MSIELAAAELSVPAGSVEAREEMGILSVEKTILPRNVFGFLTACFKKKKETNKETSKKKIKKEEKRLW